jgi:hypothetical protein
MKLVKLSVAAAMAAGLATSASAVELTEAIKGVDISGYVRYRFDSAGGDTGRADLLQAETANNEHAYKVRVKAVVPVNDDVNFVGLMGNFDHGANGTRTDDSFYGSTNWGVIHAYFQYTGVENLVVQAGKQAMPTPWNDDEHGNGLVALYNVGPVTLAGGYFDSQNAFNMNNDKGNNVAALGVIGSIEMIGFDVWYADHQETFDSYTVDVHGNIMDIATVGVRHTVLDFDDNDNFSFDGGDKQKLTKVYANASIEMIDLTAQYVRGGGNGSYVSYDTDAKTAFALEQAALGQDFTAEDADAFHLGVAVNLGKITVGLDYVDGDYDDADNNDEKTDFTEVVPSIKYQMSDNFYVKALYSDYEVKVDGDKTDSTLARVEVKYSF